MPVNMSSALGAATPWVSGSSYPQWTVVVSPTNAQPYIRTAAAGSGTTDPSADPSNWRRYGENVKSRQRVVFNIAAASSGNATISAVDTAKCELRWLGAYTPTSGAALTGIPALVNSTTVSATFGTNVNVNVSIEIVEYL